MLKKKMGCIALSALLMFAAVGCSAKEGNSTPLPQNNPATSTEEPQAEFHDEPSQNTVQTASDNEYGIDFFVVPGMTAEQQLYYTKYVHPLLLCGLLRINWSADNYSAIPVEPDGGTFRHYMMFAFEDIVGLEQMQTLFQEYEGVFPAEVIEDVLLKHFPFTSEQLHEIMAHHYDAQTNTYNYDGGRGGGPIEGVVTNIHEFSENGQEFISLGYEIFTGYSGLDVEPAAYLYKTPGVLTLKQNPDGSYLYWSAEAGEEIEAPTVR